ncbi:DNA glycosylase [Chloropicon primus]|uniref:Adenine DNA glycosylase n=1 Tax=Chloropicon primus TaxID=1764295 RepID=A0A5B8MNV0_9CHLO|nr:DNA glycosylase [Chloropicon primus]UPR01387.1 DNA glycosylase [Chloropicon primus]|eukprot:QDZ22169.1 DNA glycosylase [Chloropicon primus]
MRKPVAVSVSDGWGRSGKESKPVRVKVEENDDGEKSFSHDEIAGLRRVLLQWYDVNHRVLPWRRNPHSVKAESKEGALASAAAAEDKSGFAYCVWVSEVMLQQTRVETVKDYYLRWMQKYPTVEDLANADIEEVNKLWAGLGYYRRARFLLEGAKYVCEHCGGKMPSQVEDLHKIPGVGLYTASAIASIAFGRRAGVVDGNVIRVLSRLRALPGDPRAPSNTKLQWKLANSIVDADRPGCFNQALMELGATVCTPKAPKCDSCPVSGSCHALQKVKSWGKKSNPPSVMDYPEKVKKKPPREETIRCCITILSVEDQSYFVLVKRPEKGLLAGLWEFPNVTLSGEGGASQESESARNPQGREQLTALVNEILENSSLEVCSEGGHQDLAEIGSFDHIFSHIKQKSVVDVVRLEADLKALEALREKERVWVMPCDSEEGIKSLSTGVRKAIKLQKAGSKSKKASNQCTLEQFFGKKK